MDAASPMVKKGIAGHNRGGLKNKLISKSDLQFPVKCLSCYLKKGRYTDYDGSGAFNILVALAERMKTKLVSDLSIIQLILI
jgi:hypothetical protein